MARPTSVSAVLTPTAVFLASSHSRKLVQMTGIRVGYLVTPAGLTATMQRVQEAQISCVSTPGQRAAIAAIEGPQEPVAAAAAHYRVNITAATDLLRAHGSLSWTPGAFYLWIDISRATDGDVGGWAERFLIEQRVAVAPGSAFGRTGEGWIRVSAAAGLDDLLAGIGRLPGPHH